MAPKITQAVAFLYQTRESASPNAILRRWSAVCDCLILFNFELYESLLEPAAQTNGDWSTMLPRLDLYVRIQSSLLRLFKTQLKRLGINFRFEDVSGFNLHATLSFNKPDTPLQQRQLRVGHHLFAGGHIYKFYCLCAHKHNHDTLYLDGWFHLFASIWLIRYHYLQSVADNDDVPLLRTVHPNTLSSFAKILFNHQIYEFLTTKPLPDASIDELRKIETIIVQDGCPRVSKTIVCKQTKPKGRRRGERGAATPSTHGVWFEDGTLRDKNDNGLKVVLLKCPCCDKIVRVRQIYLEKMHFVCLKEKRGHELVDTPYLDIQRSHCTEDLSRDRSFQNFRAHIRECMRLNDVSPDHHHYRFFGYYDPESLGKGHKSRPFKRPKCT